MDTETWICASCDAENNVCEHRYCHACTADRGIDQAPPTCDRCDDSASVVVRWRSDGRRGDYCSHCYAHHVDHGCAAVVNRVLS